MSQIQATHWHLQTFAFLFTLVFTLTLSFTYFWFSSSPAASSFQIELYLFWWSLSESKASFLSGSEKTNGNLWFHLSIRISWNSSYGSLIVFSLSLLWYHRNNEEASESWWWSTGSPRESWDVLPYFCTSLPSFQSPLIVCEAAKHRNGFEGESITNNGVYSIGSPFSPIARADSSPGILWWAL